MADATATRTRPISTQTITTPSVNLSKPYKLDTFTIHGLRTGLSRVYQQLILLKAPADTPGAGLTPSPVSSSPPSLPPIIARKHETLNGTSAINEQHHDPSCPGSTKPRQTESNSQPSFTPVLQEGSLQGAAEDGDYIRNGTQKDVSRFEVPPSKVATASPGAPVSAPTVAYEDVEVRATRNYLVEIPFNEHFTIILSKSKGSYMDMAAKIPDALNDEWNKVVKPKLDPVVKALIQVMNGGKDNIQSTTQFYMVGTRHGDKLLAEPTIVISCGTKNCKRKLAAQLNKLKLHHLAAFDHPMCVRYQPQLASWAASLTKDGQAGESTAGLPTLQDVCIEQSDMPAISGLKMKFDVQQADTVQQRYATLGGVIGIDESIFIMTTAHTFLADVRSANNTSSSDDISRTDSSSDSDGDADLAEPSMSSVSSPPHDTIDFASLWTSKIKTAIAYSFLGEVAPMGNSISFDPSSSDWALFEVPNTHPLLSKFATSVKTSSVITASQLTSGNVQILDTVNTLCTGFLTQTSASIHTGQAVMDVREVLLHNPLSPGASGAWIVRENNVCGYIVAITKKRRSCFMVTMEHAFKEIETVHSTKVKLGRELIALMKEAPIIGGAFSSPPIMPEDRSRKLGAAISHDEIQPNESTTTPVLRARTSKVSRLWNLPERRHRPPRADRSPDLVPLPPISTNPDDNYDIETAINAFESELDVDIPESGITRRGPIDDRNPKRWDPWTKRQNFCIILSLVFLNSFASTVIAPSAPSMMRDLRSSSHLLGSFVIFVYELGQITGPLLLVPLSDKYGRPAVYHISAIHFIIFNIACAVAPSMSTLIAFRFLAGCAAACPLAVGHSSMKDMYLDKKERQRLEMIARRRSSTGRPRGLFIFKERSQALAALTIASMLGSSIAPIPGGYWAEQVGWRWVFGTISIVGALVAYVAWLRLSETNERLLLRRLLSRHLNLPEHRIFRNRRSCNFLFNLSIPQAIKRPLRLLKSSRTVTILILCLALMKGYMYLFYTTLTPIFTPIYSYSTKWHLSQGKAGLVFLGMFIGTIIGSVIGSVLFQWAYDRLDQTMVLRDRAIAQHRQLPLVPSSLILCYGIISFGWSVGRAKQLIVPLAATLLASLGSSLTVLTIEAYLDDIFVRDSADAIAASNFLGSLMGGLLPIACQALYVSPLGIKWTYTLVGIVALAILERTWYLWREGKLLDTNPTGRSEERESIPEEIGAYELPTRGFDQSSNGDLTLHPSSWRREGIPLVTMS